MKDVERRLRRAFREDESRRDDVEGLLARIHAGARRRRRRRAVAGIAAVGVLAATPVALAWWDQEASAPVAGGSSSARPTPAPTPTDKPTVKSASMFQSRSVDPRDISVTSMTAVDQDRLWVFGRGTCSEGWRCPLVGRSVDGGSSFQYTNAPPDRGKFHGLRFSADGSNGWLYGRDVWTTHDEGRTWADVSIPGSAAVGEVGAWRDEVYAFSSLPEDPDEPAPVSTTRVESDHWRPLDLDFVGPSEHLEAGFVAGVGDRVVAGGVDGTEEGDVLVATDDKGASWVEQPMFCPGFPTSSGVEGAVWLLCSSERQDRLYLTSDPTAELRPVDLPVKLDTAVVGGIDPERVLVAGAPRTYLVNMDGTVQRVTPLEPAPERYVYAGFTTPDVGYVIAGDGRMARTEDGGRTWEALPLP